MAKVKSKDEKERKAEEEEAEKLLQEVVAGENDSETEMAAGVVEEGKGRNEEVSVSNSKEEIEQKTFKEEKQDNVMKGMQLKAQAELENDPRKVKEMKREERVSG